MRRLSARFITIWEEGSLHLSALLIGLSTLFPGPSPGLTPITIKSAWIALQVGDGVPTDGEVRVVKGKPVNLYIVIEADIGGKARVITTASRLKKRGRRIPSSRIIRWPAHAAKPKIQYLKLEPITSDGMYDNTGKLEHSWLGDRRKSHPKGWHWCPIQYVETVMKWGSVWHHAADTQPTKAPNRYGGLGTMRYVVRVRFGDRTVYSRGREHRDKAGLRSGIATVRVRRDNTAVGYMTELINVPYVYGSHTPTGRIRDHQAERAVGADCADMVVYGWRRSGRNIAYTWTEGLKKHTRRMVGSATLVGSKYVDRSGQPIQFGKRVKVGDIVLWHRHVAVIAATDKSGTLTPQTQIIHTIHGSPALIPLSKVGFGYTGMPFQVRRPRWEKP